MKIAVVGMGLIGTSVALAARRAWPSANVTGLDRGDALDALTDAAVIVLATPVDVIIDTLKTKAQHFGDAVVLDTGSTKRIIVAAARERGLANFVGGHPMAGTATAGPGAARADMFDGKRWFLVPADPASSAIVKARSFVEALRAAPVVLADDGTEHDRVMAAVSHLPQVAASVLMKIVGEAAGHNGLQWAGSGLRDTTRLAQSPAGMWESILATNASELRPLLVEFADALRRFAEDLDNPRAVRQLFDTANRYRDIVN